MKSLCISLLAAASLLLAAPRALAVVRCDAQGCCTRPAATAESTHSEVVTAHGDGTFTRDVSGSYSYSEHSGVRGGHRGRWFPGKLALRATGKAVRGAGRLVVGAGRVVVRGPGWLARKTFRPQARWHRHRGCN